MLITLVYIKHLYMNLKPVWRPKLPKDIIEKQLFSTYLKTKELPVVQMTMAKDGPFAKVDFNFGYANTKKTFLKEFSGPSDKIYKDAARQASKIGLNFERLFNKAWNTELLKLLNSPSKNKSVLNIDNQKNKENFGLYTVKTP